MQLFYVDNSEYRSVEGKIAELEESEETRIEPRNPRYFSGPKELRRADKVYLYGKHTAVERAAKEMDVELVHVSYSGEQIPMTEDSKTPSEDWDIEELVEVARANGINATTRWNKPTIVEKLNEIDDSQ